MTASRESSVPGEADARLRLLVEQLPAVVWTLDLDLRFTSSMGAGLAKIGLQPGQMVGRTLQEMRHDAGPDHPVFDAHRRASVGESVTFDDEFDGQIYRSHVEPLRDKAGRIIGCIGVAHDITEVKHVEAELRRVNHELEERVAQRATELVQSNRRLREQMQDRVQAETQLHLVQSAVDQVTDAVIITDAELDPPGPRIIYVNPAFERISGYAAGEVMGQTPRLLQGPGTSRGVLDALRDSLQAGRPFHGETVNYRKDGQHYVVDWRIAPIRGEQGQITHWVAIMRDVTDQRRAQEQAEQHRAELAHASRLTTMGEMASGLAHELNQPLAAILNYARGCLRRIDTDRITPAELRDAVDRIATQAQRAGQIIQRLRHFVRKREPRRTLTNLNDLVRDAVGLVEGEARNAGVAIHLDLASDLPPVAIDAIQIEQVVLNLLRNAVESLACSDRDDRQIVVRSRRDTKARTLCIDVSDNGPGIRDQLLDHIFSPFYTTKKNGMGMGLTLSTTIVEGHGGRLTVTRNADQGLTFHLTLADPSPPIGV